MQSSTEPRSREIVVALRENAGPDAGSVEVLLAQLDDPEHLALRCAWCGRMEIASEWVTVSLAKRALRLLHERTTHGICPDCLAGALRAGATAAGTR